MQGYVSDLHKRGIMSLGYPWNSEADEEAMFEALRVRKAFSPQGLNAQELLDA